MGATQPRRHASGRDGKTVFTVTGMVSAETIEALRAIQQKGDPRLLPWPIQLRKLYRDYKQLRKIAGLPTGRRNAFQKLRRTSATFVERETPGAATQHLGHRSPQLAQQHYVDRSIAHKPRLPPRIGGEAGKAAS
jgi:hypothetical protein